MMIIGADTVFYNVITDAAHPLNGRSQMTLNVKSKNPALKKILYAAADTGTVHFWNTRLTIYGGGNWGYGFTAPAAGYVLGDKNYGIGHPGVTSSVITAAAHKTNFLLTGFSSYGPRMDGVLKPDISAPGENIISSFNSFAKENITPVTTTSFNGKNYEFIKLSGTSMSAPMVTGVVSLILEANPNLSSAEVKELILGSARTDNLTGTIGPEGDVRWGYGKLDAYRAIQALLGTGLEDINSTDHLLFPNPAGDMVYVTQELEGNETYRLFAWDGKLVESGKFNGTLKVKGLINGLYVLEVENANAVKSYRLSVVH
jgi:hypothetical protein